MGIESNSPKIATLKMAVQKEFGKVPKVHNDFVELVAALESKLKTHISETTLERVWNYSNRGYESISLYTLNLLCRYIGKSDWQDFCNSLAESGIIDSDMFEVNFIKSEELHPGDRIKIGWLPDRLCIVEYLGNNRFVALECENSTMRPGDSFQCIEFILNQPLNMDNFIKKGEETGKDIRYVAGKRHGLTTLMKL